MNNKDKKIKLMFYTITLCLTIVYLIYRTFYSLPVDSSCSFIFAFIVLSIELIDAFFFFIYYINVLIYKKESPLVPKIRQKEYPDVDIFIATINEDLSLIEENILACKKIKYYDKKKVHIYVCDDGHRNAVKTLCTDLNVDYITRDNNINFKAGNYNNALSKTKSPYILMLDVDMCPKPDILKKTIPFFINDSNVGFVQTPQSFKNFDIFQLRFKLFNKIPFEQDYFYKKIQMAKNHTNSVVFCGTNAVLSRKALEDIGGFATESVTEDIVTGMLIEAKGYKGIAISETLAVGMNVNNLNSFLKQRKRWCRGSIQMLKNYPIFHNKGLNWKQKLEYLSSIYYWFFGIRNTIYLIVPLLFSLFNIKIIYGNFLIFLTLFCIQYFLKRFILDLLENNKISSTWNRIYEIILMPVMSFEVLKELIFNKEKKFDVTDKNKMKNNIFQVNKSLLIFHFIFMVLTFVGIITSIVKGYIYGYKYYIIPVIWLLINLFYLIIAFIFDVSTKKNKFEYDVKVNNSKYHFSSVFCLFKNYLLEEFNYKRFAVYLLFFLFSFLLIYKFPSYNVNLKKIDTNFVDYNGWLSVNGENIVNDNGEIFSLRGVSSHNLYWFESNYTFNNLKELKEWGVNVFRIAVYTSPIEEGYVKNKYLINFVKDIIDYCIELDMYVIVDWHILNDNNPLIYEDEAIEFFDEISKQYANVPNVIYEICNEPNGDDVKWLDDIKPYAENLISTIRKNSSKSLIVVGTANWCKDILAVAESPIIAENVLYAVHTYPDEGVEDLREDMNEALERGIPIIVTECAPTDPTGNSYLFYDFFEGWIDYLESNNISWVAWQFSDKPELASILLSRKEKYISLNGDIEKIKELEEKEYSINDYLSKTGIYIKNLIEKYKK